ncbi:MAG TPA: ATP-binding protein [Nitrospirota bacterium]|nr:ATP-binding protein [Nitrospirota bacterium]
MYRNSDELLSILRDGIEGLLSLDTEDKVLGSALSLCMDISKTTSGYIIRRTGEDRWRIDGTSHSICIPSDLLKHVFSGGTFKIDYELTNLLPLELRRTINTIIPINVDGRINSALLFHNDSSTLVFSILSLYLSSVLSRLNILKEIGGMKTHYDDILVKKEEAERLASLGYVAAGLAHEIKNPLVSIKTLAQLLPERYDDQEFRYQFTNIAISEIDRIVTIISDLLNFAKTSEPNFALLDIQCLIDEVIALLSARFKECGIFVSKNYLPQAPAIYGDRSQLKQLFLNIFLNSHEAMNKGGGISVDLTIGKDSDEIKKVIIKITDTGAGIEKNTMQHVFEPFFTTKEKGTGLGLSICKRMISNHGGKIFLDSIDKLGTTVTVELPVNNAT